MRHVGVVEEAANRYKQKSGKSIVYSTVSQDSFIRAGFRGWHGGGSCAINVLLSTSKEVQRKAYDRILPLTY